VQALEEPDVAGPPESGRRHSTIRYIVISVVVMWVLSSVALLIYTAGTRGSTDRELVIPRGTSELIASGLNPLDIPKEWDFISGDTLLLRNEDDVHHWIGQWFVDAGDTTIVELQPVYAGVLVCSVHPSGQIDIRVEPGGYDWKLPLFPALLLGVPLGLMGSGVRRVVGALAREEEDAHD
jgi:hypothetical protein